MGVQVQFRREVRWRPGAFFPEQGDPDGFPAYLLICENCGLMRLHATAAVEGTN
jgi:hypothetical protein